MNIIIYQISSERDENRVCFMGLDSLAHFQGSEQIDSSIYDKVYEGEVACANLEDVYQMFNLDHPANYRGRSLSVSDVVEVNGAARVEPGFYFCNSIGFQKVTFEPEKAQQPKQNAIRVVLLEPGKLAQVTAIDASLSGMESGEDITHKAVKEAKEQRAAEEYKGTLPGMIEAQEAAEAEREQEEQNMDTPNNPFAEECPETGNACNNWERMKRAYLHNGTIQNCAGCCAFCTKAETCPIVCDTVKFSQPQPQQVDAHPDHVTALCYSCAKWSDCMDKAATVTSCDQYAKANTKPQATPEPVKTYTEEETESAPAGSIMTREPRTDEQLLGILRSAGLKSLISSACVTPQEKNRLNSLIASMWARWEQTGGWNG